MYFYKKTIPAIGDSVIVKITEFPEKGDSIQCKLLEYNDITGIILRTEVTKKKEIEPKKIFKIDEKYVMFVLNVDEEDTENIKIDLSNTKLNDGEKLLYMKDFKCKENIYNCAYEMSIISKLDINIILKYSMWKFMENTKILEDLNEFYHEILEDPKIFTHYFPDQYSEICKNFVDNLKSRITSSDEIATKNFTFVVFKPIEGKTNLDTLKWCLTNNLDTEHNVVNCEITFISPAKYSITSKSNIKSETTKNIDIVESIIKENIKNIYCKFEIDQLCKIYDKQFTLKKLFIQ